MFNGNNNEPVHTKDNYWGIEFNKDKENDSGVVVAIKSKYIFKVKRKISQNPINKTSCENNEIPDRASSEINKVDCINNEKLNKSYSAENKDNYKRNENLHESSEAKIKASREDNGKVDKSEYDANRVKNIRLRYLIGKKVGEDIFNIKGSRIAKKGSLITEELIDIVEKEGKMAELIINMIFPEAE